MSVVLDASVVVAALVDDGPVGAWAEELLLARPSAPHVLPVEVAQVLRRAVVRGRLPDEVATLAHADLVALPVQLVAYAGVADRVWELRHAVSAYDAWYVAVAELLDLPLATLDTRLARAPGPRCQVLLPPGA